MALKTGQRSGCPDQACGCEISVTKGANPGTGGAFKPRCCCRMEMQQVG